MWKEIRLKIFHKKMFQKKKEKEKENEKKTSVDIEMQVDPATRCLDFGKTTARVTVDVELSGGDTSKSLLMRLATAMCSILK